ncbi:molybdate ABC transporter substrate-binding protein [Campylobacter sp. RM12327]|uniref:molybdate ABC transporter substrate-binding protein n=1 Tax=Campylobacter sputorum TaxID=206 RepID=UPI000B775AAE|nr:MULTISPECIES: molybdate ABC transporter substrate-binding protein [Campylobacter]ASM39609.1 molybdenum ABC transporter ModABC, periplasmic molybdate-binding protein [Campylobacter sputorum]MBE7358309.1 molybdate ABC transporter substrate-binding protein [Campylobacter sp. RM11302]MBF6669471.1 molybdate ABC transporter substrate-binding protein [Campylobacter sp. RM12327]MBF6674786.1 molybdate ABC transporter substrate-binding protein [Campylobacter sp. RM13538]MBF6676606.1 molybdate ABC tra
MKRLFLLILVSACLLNAASIRVAAAANIGYVFEELKKEFLKTRPNDKVEVTLGSSGKLNAQIKAGANYAIFMAANMDFADDLYKNGFSKNAPEIYTRGVLMMFSKEKRDMDKGLELLKDDKIHKIAVANTKTAPYGIASLEAFKKSGVYESIKDKIVQADSISGVLPYALTAAEIGFIPKSGLAGKDEYKKGENFMEVDRSLYTPIDQAMVLIKAYENNTLAQDFYKFIKSDVAKSIFAKHGYE